LDVLRLGLPQKAKPQKSFWGWPKQKVFQNDFLFFVFNTSKEAAAGSCE
jgi:hypothetical protein